jgi:tetratricopeptide (TPR) repeat protein
MPKSNDLYQICTADFFAASNGQKVAGRGCRNGCRGWLLCGAFTQKRPTPAAKDSEPGDWNLWYYLGATRAQLKEIAPAIEAFAKACSPAPHEARVYFGLGLLYMQKGDADKVLGAYRGGLAQDSTDAGANQNYALLLMRSGNFGEAVKPLPRLKGIPTRFPRAISEFENLVQQRPNSSRVQYFLGCSFPGSG